MSLPDPAHNTIASYLTQRDMTNMMEVSPWCLQAYGSRVKVLGLRGQYGGFNGVFQPAGDGSTVASLLRRRDQLTHLRVQGLKITLPVAGITQAFQDGQGQKLESLELSPYMEEAGDEADFVLLFQALSEGACPKLSRLKLRLGSDADALVVALGDALSARMEKGLSGLSMLGLHRRNKYDDRNLLSDLLPILTSGACESLEELSLDCHLMSDAAQEGVANWLHFTRAPHLRSFATFGDYSTIDLLITALSLPNVAPAMEELDLGGCEDNHVLLLSQGLKQQGKWPRLRTLKIQPLFDPEAVLPSLVEALYMCDLRCLALWDGSIYDTGAKTLAKGLLDGACPRLEELDLSRADIDCGTSGLAELARAMESGAPCSTTLRKLNLKWCNIGVEGVTALVGAMTRNALPNLEVLDLGRNHLGDDGMVALAQGMESPGVLQHLVELGLNNMRMGDRGLMALQHALIERGACPKLKKLEIGDNGDISHGVGRAFMVSLRGARVGFDRKVEIVGGDYYDQDEYIP